ncbi:TIGR03643 family protein [uncultured Sulfitobacter sp.]|uniref:TIGR03643 family protein n=1 Tax=uncultured Sulfitobacter sp. TaxID=191468 RepID=UPI002631978E|nr:TIGR03643 family protein [uncultured Sulfitobacter sp.]
MSGPEKQRVLAVADVSAIIQMALSDHVPFATIEMEYGLSEKEVQALMRRELKAGSYRAWRKRVHAFGTRREQYK